MEHDYTTSQTPAKGVQVGLEPTPTPNAATAAIQASIPGFGGNLIEVDIVTNKNKSAVYTSKAYPANADGKQRPGAVVEYSSEFSVGEGIGKVNVLPDGYLAVEFVYTDGNQFIDTGLRRVDESSCAEFLGEVVSNSPWARRAFQTRGLAFSTETRVGPGSWWVALPFGVDVAVSSMITRPINMPNDHISPQYNVRIEYKRAIINGEVYTEADMSAPSETQTSDSDNTLKLFAYSDGANYKSSWWVGTCRRFKAKAKNGKINLIPAIDTTGTPCMYDMASRKPFFKEGTGEFAVGLTLAQARKLYNLPTGGGMLTVYLPSNWQEDDGVVNALSKAESKGWVFTYRTYDADASVSTFGMRRIWVRKTQNDNGEYMAVNGSRWSVEWCVGMIGAEPEAHGYEPYRSIEAAVAYWELEPYVYPEEEFLQDIKYN